MRPLDPCLDKTAVTEFHPNGSDIRGSTAIRPQRPSRAALVATAALAFGVVTGADAAGPAKGTSHTSADAPNPNVTTVAGVTVIATRTVPKVESTFPAKGAKVTPGLLILRVTFTDKMREDGWSYVPDPHGQYPDCAQSPRLLDDKRSFVLICRTLPSKAYAVWFNRPPLVDFNNYGRRSAIPFELTFTTTADDPVRTLPEAMKADPALSKFSNPVEPEGLAAIGQPHIPPQ